MKESIADPQTLGIIELVEQTASTGALLVEKQVALLRAEVNDAIAHERSRAIALGVGALICGIGLSLVLVAAAFAIGRATGWVVTSIVSGGVLLVVGGGVSMVVALKMSASAFAGTRRVIEEEVAWAEKQITQASPTSSTTSNDSAVESRP